MAARIVDKKAKRKHIIQAAMSVFAKQGMNNFKMVDIAEAASIGKGTIYEYFPSKDDLIIGSIGEFFEDFEAYLIPELAKAAGPVEKIERLIGGSVEFCLDDPVRLETLCDLFAGAIPRKDGKPALCDLAPKYIEMTAWMKTVIDEGIEKGVFAEVDSEIVAKAIFALLDGLFLQAAIGVVSLEYPGIVEKLTNMLLHGLLIKDYENIES